MALGGDSSEDEVQRAYEQVRALGQTLSHVSTATAQSSNAPTGGAFGASNAGGIGASFSGPNFSSGLAAVRSPFTPTTPQFPARFGEPQTAASSAQRRGPNVSHLSPFMSPSDSHILDDASFMRDAPVTATSTASAMRRPPAVPEESFSFNPTLDSNLGGMRGEEEERVEVSPVLDVEIPRMPHVVQIPVNAMVALGPGATLTVQHLREFLSEEFNTSVDLGLGAICSDDVVVRDKDSQRPLFKHQVLYAAGATPGSAGEIYAKTITIGLKQDEPTRTQDRRWTSFVQEAEASVGPSAPHAGQAPSEGEEVEFFGVLDRLDTAVEAAVGADNDAEGSESEQREDMLKDFLSGCAETALQQFLDASNPSALGPAAALHRGTASPEVQTALREEFATWQILHDLHARQLLVNVSTDVPVQSSGDPEQRAELTDFEVVECHLLDAGTDPAERQYGFQSDLMCYRIVRLWLEHCFDKTAHRLEVKPNENRPAFWANSHAALRRAGGGGMNTSFSSSFFSPTKVAANTTVDRLDPDAPVRPGSAVGGVAALPGTASVAHPYRSLADADQDTERDLLRDMWRLIRGGNTEAALHLCKNDQRQSSWRAAMLLGFDLHDVIVNQATAEQGMVDDAPATIEPGNPLRGLWRQACWEMGRAADTSSMSGTERKDAIATVEAAICAAMCGDLETLATSPLVRDWEDKAWAFFRCLEHLGIQKCLVDHHQLQASLSAHYPSGEVLPVEQGHLSNLESSVRSAVSKSTNTHIGWSPSFDRSRTAAVVFNAFSPTSPSSHREIQRAAIEGSTAKLWEAMQRVRDAVQGSKAGELGQLKRFGAHMVIFMRLNGMKHPTNDVAQDTRIGDPILVSYVDHLEHKGLITLVALYLKHVNESHRKVQRYVSFLRHIREYGDRESCTKLATMHFAPREVDEITRSTVRDIRWLNLDEEFKDDERMADDAVSCLPQDVVKIRSLQWLTVVEEHKPEAIAQANALLRQFIVGPSAAEAGEVDRFDCDEATAPAVRMDMHLFISQAGLQHLGGTLANMGITSMDVARTLSDDQLAGFGFKERDVRRLRSGRNGATGAGGEALWRRKFDAAEVLMTDNGTYLLEAFPDKILEACRAAQVTKDRPPLEWACVLKEHLNWRAYLIAHSQFKAFQKLVSDLKFAQERQPPGPLVSNNDDVVEQQHHANKVLKEWLEGQSADLETRLAQVTKAVTAVLECGEDSFFDEVLYMGKPSDPQAILEAMRTCGLGAKGWMCYAEDPFTGVAQRADPGLEAFEAHYRERRHLQSETLRRQCLPGVINMLVDALTDAGKWYVTAAAHIEELMKQWTRIRDQSAAVEAVRREAANRFRSAVKVADLVASRQFGLYNVMSNAEMRELMAKLQDASFQLIYLRPGLGFELEA